MKDKRIYYVINVFSPNDLNIANLYYLNGITFLEGYQKGPSQEEPNSIGLSVDYSELDADLSDLAKIKESLINGDMNINAKSYKLELCQDGDKYQFKLDAFSNKAGRSEQEASFIEGDYLTRQEIEISKILKNGLFSTDEAIQKLLEKNVNEMDLASLFSNGLNMAFILKNIYKELAGELQEKEIKENFLKRPKIEMPDKIIALTNLEKRMATNPANRLNSQGSMGQPLLSFTVELDNAITDSKGQKSEMIIQPSELLQLEARKQGLAPLDRNQDKLIDVISTLIVKGCFNLDLKNRNITKFLDAMPAIDFEENMVAKLFFNNDRQTEKQLEELRNVFDIITSTPMYLNDYEKMKWYNKTMDLGIEEGEIEKLKKAVKTNVIQGTRQPYYDKRYNKIRFKYRIYEAPVFLRQAIMTQHFRTIPASFYKVKGANNTQRFRLTRDYLAKIVGEADSKIDRGERLDNRHKCVTFKYLQEEYGVNFGDNHGTLRKKKGRLKEQLEGYFKDTLLKESKYLADFDIEIDHGIYLIYRGKSGKILKSTKRK